MGDHVTMQTTIAAWAGMQASDWVSNGIAVLALLAAIWLGIWSNRKNAAAELRQQAFAEAQQALAEAQHDTNTRLVEAMVRLAKPTDSASPKELSQVQWVAEHISKNRWLLRNLGVGIATDVTVDKAALGGVRVDITPDLPADIGPGESVGIVAIGSWGSSVADEVRVTWDSDQHATVPLPRWQ
jgi:type II secretory pathway pseudopilin PulG